MRRHGAFGPYGLGHSAMRPAQSQAREGLEIPLSGFTLRISESQNSAGFATNLPSHGQAFGVGRIIFAVSKPSRRGIFRGISPDAGGRRSLFRRAAAGCNRPEEGRSPAKRSALRVQPTFLGPPDGRLFRPPAAIEEMLLKVGVRGGTCAESSGT